MTPATEGGGSDARGVSLQAVVGRAGSPPPAAALLLLDDVLERLEHTRAAGVEVDLQPASVFVDQHGRCNVRTLNDTSGFAGSPALREPYTAPEVRRGGRPGAASDVYAATALFVEALTGMAPGIGRAVILSAEGESPAPIGIRRLVESGLADDPATRPAGAAELRLAVAAAAVEAFPGHDWRSRGRAWLSAASPAPVTPAAPSASYTPSFTPSLTPPFTPPPFGGGPAPPPGRGESDEQGPAPGMFWRLFHGDRSVVAGFLITVSGLLLIIIGAGAASGLSGPRISAASVSPTAPASPTNAGPTPEDIGSEFIPVAPPPPPGSPSASPSESASASPTAVATPVPSDQPPPSFVIEPTTTPAPTATPGSCLILCPGV